MTTDIQHYEDTQQQHERERKRKAALLRAIGLDRVPDEQRELALNIAQRYDLDLMLQHLVLVDGRPYITRDGLLHVAHRSGEPVHESKPRQTLHASACLDESHEGRAAIEISAVVGRVLGE